MKIRYLLLFLLLGSIAYADTDCNTSYTDDLKVRTLDIKSRPFGGATVYIYHQYSGSFGADGTYHSIGPLTTDSSGITEVTIGNIEQTEKYLDCDIRINASEGGAFSKVTVIANAHPEFIDLKLDVYPLNVYVRDQNGIPIEGAKVSINNKIINTDSTGLARFHTVAGEIDYFVSYLDAKQSGEIEVVNDTTYGIIIPTYSVSIEIVDDKGNPLNSSITISNKKTELPDGKYSQDKIFGEEIEFTTQYSGIIKNLKMYPAIDNSQTVVYDLSVPIIDIPGVKKEEIDGKVRLTISVNDPGMYPSEIDTSSVSITYRIEASNDTAWNSATTYVSKKDTFIVDFPEFPPNSLIQFKIVVSDKEGNIASATGRFSTLATETPTDVTKPQPNDEVEGHFPLMEVVIGGLIIIFVIYLLVRIKGMKEENQ
jgi:hypothetical protein